MSVLNKKSKHTEVSSSIPVSESQSKEDKPFIDTTLEKHFNLIEKKPEDPYKKPRAREPTPQLKRKLSDIKDKKCHTEEDITVEDIQKVMEPVITRLDKLEVSIERLRDMLFEELQDV